MRVPAPVAPTFGVAKKKSKKKMEREKHICQKYEKGENAQGTAGKNHTKKIDGRKPRAKNTFSKRAMAK
jgi:hypothetical protein